MTPLQKRLFSKEQLEAYQPRKVDGFSPLRIVLAKGTDTTAARQRLAENICAAYPEAEADGSAHLVCSLMMPVREPTGVDHRAIS